MAGINIQSNEHPSRFISETSLVPACHSLTGGSSNPPKFGTLIPNRIFVGGIPSNTTEQELKSFFSSFGQVKDVKIISDRLGVSKGSYGFVTFESQEMAEKIIKNESETLIFKDRKLNIGHAIRKQQMFPRPDLPAALFFAGGAVPYGFQNGMAVFPLPGQEYPMLTQAAAPYATMMLHQPGGSTALYLPPSLHSAATATGSAYAPISQHAVNAAMQQQQFQQAASATGITPAVVGQLNPVTGSTNSTGAQSNSTAAVMAAAAAAMAAAVQWPQQATQANGQQNTQQLAAAMAAAHGVAQAAGNQQTATSTTAISQQAAAMAAAVAAQQQAAWRWSPSVQQSQNTVHASSPSQATVCPATTSTGAASQTASTPTLPTQNLQQQQQQGSANASLGTATYLYSPLTGNGHELMFFQQTSSPYTANSTSDYSTDHSTHSSGILESAESLSFQCDGTPIGRHSQLGGPITNAYGSPHFDATCLSPYAAFAPLLDLQSHTTGIGPQGTVISSAQLHHQLRQAHQATTFIPTQAAAATQHLIPIANNAAPLASQSQQKIFSNNALPSMGAGTPRQLPSTAFSNSSIKNNALSELGPSGDLPVGSMTQGQNLQSQNCGTGGTGSAASSVNAQVNPPSANLSSTTA